MTDNWTDRRLQTALEQLRDAVSYPRTPPLAARVQRRLEQPTLVRPARGPEHRRFWYAAAALLLAVIIASLSWPQAREAVADRLGLRGVRVTQGPEPAQPPAPRDPRALLGARVDLDTARSSVRFPILIPAIAELGQPDEVYLNAALPGGEVSLVYGPRPSLPFAPQWNELSLIISQTEGHRLGPSYEKGAGPGTQVRYVHVGEDVGIWLEGAPHRFQYLGPDGAGQVGEARLAANVLVWGHDQHIIRIEGAMPLDVALRIATSLR